MMPDDDHDEDEDLNELDVVRLLNEFLHGNVSAGEILLELSGNAVNQSVFAWLDGPIYKALQYLIDLKIDEHCVEISVGIISNLLLFEECRMVLIKSLELPQYFISCIYDEDNPYIIAEFMRGLTNLVYCDQSQLFLPCLDSMVEIVYYILGNSKSTKLLAQTLLFMYYMHVYHTTTTSDSAITVHDVIEQSSSQRSNDGVDNRTLLQLWYERRQVDDFLRIICNHNVVDVDNGSNLTMIELIKSADVIGTVGYTGIELALIVLDFLSNHNNNRIFRRHSDAVEYTNNLSIQDCRQIITLCINLLLSSHDANAMTHDGDGSHREEDVSLYTPCSSSDATLGNSSNCSAYKYENMSLSLSEKLLIISIVENIFMQSCGSDNSDSQSDVNNGRPNNNFKLEVFSWIQGICRAFMTNHDSECVGGVDDDATTLTTTVCLHFITILMDSVEDCVLMNDFKSVLSIAYITHELTGCLFIVTQDSLQLNTPSSLVDSSSRNNNNNNNNNTGYDSGRNDATTDHDNEDDKDSIIADSHSNHHPIADSHSNSSVSMIQRVKLIGKSSRSSSNSNRRAEAMRGFTRKLNAMLELIESPSMLAKIQKQDMDKSEDGRRLEEILSAFDYLEKQMKLLLFIQRTSANWDRAGGQSGMTHGCQNCHNSNGGVDGSMSSKGGTGEDSLLLIALSRIQAVRGATTAALTHCTATI